METNSFNSIMAEKTVFIFLYIAHFYMSICIFYIVVFIQSYPSIFSDPFNFFWVRQSKVFKQLFKELWTSFLGTMELILEEEDYIDENSNGLLSAYLEQPCTDVVDESPKEEMPVVPVVERVDAVTTRRRRQVIRLPPRMHPY